jgi:hypothetical protein
VTDGRVPHALLLEIFTNAGIGTMVTQDGLIRLGSRVFPRDEGIPPHEYDNGEFGVVPVLNQEDHDLRFCGSQPRARSLSTRPSAPVLEAYATR